jgi:cytochrome c2
MTGRIPAVLRSSANPPALIAIGGCLSLVAVAVLLLQDSWPEWRRHQAAYRSQLLAASHDEASRSYGQRFRIQVRQIDLPVLQRVDRCTSCHVGIEDPGFVDAAAPLTTHPGTILRAHPPDRFGCTICHGGNGLATLRDDAHGLPEPSLHPMLRGEYLQSSCGKCHEDDEFVEGSRLEVGRRLFEHYGCRTCHRLYQSGSTAGPDLTRVGSKKYDAFYWGEEYRGTPRNVPYWLETHFKQPSAFYPSGMLDFKMTDENARALVVYMLSLTGEPIPDTLRPRRR